MKPKSRKSSLQIAETRLARRAGWKHAEWTNLQVDSLCQALLKEHEQKTKLKQELAETQRESSRVARLEFKVAQQARWINDLTGRYRRNLIRRRKHGLPTDDFNLRFFNNPDAPER